MFAAGIAVALILSVVALVMTLVARSAARARQPGDADERVAALEERVRGLVYRVWKLGGRAGRLQRRREPTRARRHAGEGARAAVTRTVTGGAPRRRWRRRPRDAPAWGTPIPAPPRGLDLEHPIGARWATWSESSPSWSGRPLPEVGLRQRLPRAGRARGAWPPLAGLCHWWGGGLLPHRRRDVPYLSEGLAGGGLGAPHSLALRGSRALRPGRADAAFVAMFSVTLVGTAVAVASHRLITAVLAVLGGLLTPVFCRWTGPTSATCSRTCSCSMGSYCSRPASARGPRSTGSRGSGRRFSSCRRCSTNRRPRVRSRGCCCCRPCS